MPTKIKLSVSLLVVFLTLTSCKDEEQYTPVKNINKTPVEETTTKSFKSDLHTVIVKEILKTDRYLYLKVIEKGLVDPFWIATRIMDITIGETYFYKGGLLKTNFESKEHNRTFDKIYLISSKLVLANHSANSNKKRMPSNKVNIDANKLKTTSKNNIIKGSIKISELVKNAKKYAGKTVQLTGVCTKINPSIMKKNWIHLKDGSLDDYDLVITSNALVKEGTTVTITALVTLNKDFGAGYKYDLILENGTVIH